MESDTTNGSAWLQELMLLESNGSHLLGNASYSDWNVDSYLATHWGPKHLPMDVVVPITIVYVLIFVSGVVGNVAVCAVIIRNPTMHTATNCYLFSLAVSDLTVLLFGLPNDLSVYWQQYPWALGEIVCKLRALIAEMTNYASVLTIVAFSLERYLAICHPLHAYTMAGLGRAARIVALIWLVALICALPFAIYTGIVYVPYPLEAGANLTGHSIPESAFCALQDDNQVTQWPLVEMATFIFFIVPMGILCLLYLRIGIRIRRTSLGRGRHVQGVVHHSNESRQSSSRRTILRMLVAVVIGFFICWAPFHAQRLLYVYAKDSPNYREINEKMFFVTGCFYFFSSTINPILYNVMSARYREAFRETLCGIVPVSRHNYSTHRRHERNGSTANTSVTWLSTTERRSMTRPSLPTNGVIKESQFISEETAADIALDGGKKTGLSNGSTSLDPNFVHHEDSNQVNSSINDSTGLINSSGQQPQLASTPAGTVYRNLEYRPSKPTEWRMQLTNVKTKALNGGGGASLPAGCTPSCLKSSQLVRRASESNRIHSTPTAAVGEHQKKSLASVSTTGEASDGHPLLTNCTSLVEPETCDSLETDPLSAPVSDASMQGTRRLS